MIMIMIRRPRIQIYPMNCVSCVGSVGDRRILIDDSTKHTFDTWRVHIHCWQNINITHVAYYYYGVCTMIVCIGRRMEGRMGSTFTLICVFACFALRFVHCARSHEYTHTKHKHYTSVSSSSTFCWRPFAEFRWCCLRGSNASTTICSVPLISARQNGHPCKLDRFFGVLYFRNRDRSR